MSQHAVYINSLSQNDRTVFNQTTIGVFIHMFNTTAEFFVSTINFDVPTFTNAAISDGSIAFVTRGLIDENQFSLDDFNVGRMFRPHILYKEYSSLYN